MLGLRGSFSAFLPMRPFKDFLICRPARMPFLPLRISINSGVLCFRALAYGSQSKRIDRRIANPAGPFVDSWQRACSLG